MAEKQKIAGNQPTTSNIIAGSPTPTKFSDAAPVVEPTSSRRRGGGQKRKASTGNGGNASTPPTTSSKRQTREKPSAVPHPPIHNGPCTRARQSPSTAAAPTVSVVAPSDAVVKSEAEAVAPPESGARGVVRPTEETSVVEEDWEALEAKIEAEYEVIRSRDINAHVVPIPAALLCNSSFMDSNALSRYAGWFSWTRVHPLEKRTLPSFFNGKSEKRTPKIYMDIRNWIMRKFHANPNIQIELKDLSELSVGELDARQEVMEFLDHWGLINYHPFPDSDSAMVNADGDGGAKTDSLVEKLFRFETEQSGPPLVPRNNVMTPTVSSGLFPESAVAEELGKPEDPEYHCNSCSADCSRRRYHCQKQADFDLCNDCFNDGKFDSDMSPMDFIVMGPAEAAGLSGGKWTDQETLLLLEALELYKENWNEIAEHVATKTKAQCILHFIQMPIEDTFMDCNDENDSHLKENEDPTTGNDDSSAPKDAPETTDGKTAADENRPESSPMRISKPKDAGELKVDQETKENCALKALKEAFEAVGSFPPPGGQFSFADAGNPVMALAAFLVRLVEPNVAAALVRSSLKSISGNPSSMQLATRHCFLLQDPPGGIKKSADSERAVAETVDQDAEKNEKQNKENQKEEQPNLVLDRGDLSSDHCSEKDKDSVREGKDPPISPNNGCREKSYNRKDSHVMDAHQEEGLDFSSNKSDNPDLPKDMVPRGAKESDHLPKDTAECSAKESDHLTSQEEIPSTSAKECPSHFTEATKSADEEELKDCHENQVPSENKDYNIDKLKHAAVTAISAAAVKAKLLADQEEDQIRQLATLLIDKQLHKLETKLALFNDMESVVMRVREQIERSKQRLYQERAQIIASRLGYSAPQSRPMQQSLPINRVATGFANSAAKPPMSMTSQRPPISRSMTTLSHSTPNTLVAATTSAGNPFRPTNQDKNSYATK
ncbi:hypothetical protein U1Q18_034885 [Sarracenia purpurea var. burkii]